MPRLIISADDRVASLDEARQILTASCFDPDDEGSLAETALTLRGLANNRGFLGDLLVDRLRGSHREIADDSGYGPQAVVLSPVGGDCFLRANIWPSVRDACFQASGARSFVYGVPHDHNFSFLTVGYFGPGYISDYYEYDYEHIVGSRGERAGLRFVERSALAEGTMLLYRAHRDVHAQLPASSMSVSLNVMHTHPLQGWCDQYGFDLEADEITAVLNPGGTETFLRCAVGLGGGEALDLAERFGRRHPSDRLRLASFEARATLAQDEHGAETIWREGLRSGSLLVAAEAAQRLDRMDRR